ncbi:MAG: hypothetical protein HOI31_12080 [Gammaproteobacteria bacterium]|jgi:hypothetical protein|nr:hypothetical protein [Gammaproteobacteria bacterium]
METDKEYLKAVGARILSEANDLKRTVAAVAEEMSVDLDVVKQIVSGEVSKEEVFGFIDRFETLYPVDGGDLRLINDDCSNGVVYFSRQVSEGTSRVFNRLDREGERTPFYEYRDTAMSKISPIKPEWIKQLRVVLDADPYNPDVIYNNGHFMHQLTFFVGPVNFYYEVNGEKKCVEMSTGDSCYITPYAPHTFTNRSPDEEAYIVAVTFGGNVRRSQKELYVLGEQRVGKYALDLANRRGARSQLVQQYMENENYTVEMAPSTVPDLEKVLKGEVDVDNTVLASLAGWLNVSVSDLMLPDDCDQDDVVICKKDEVAAYRYPNQDTRNYSIYPGARIRRLPDLKSFEVVVESSKVDMEQLFSSALHSYIYNYSDHEVEMIWEHERETHSVVLSSWDSAYVQPFVKYGFSSKEKKGNIFIVRVGGSVNLCTQKELSSFIETGRAAKESKCWFD